MTKENLGVEKVCFILRFRVAVHQWKTQGRSLQAATEAHPRALPNPALLSYFPLLSWPTSCHWRFSLHFVLPSNRNFELLPSLLTLFWLQALCLNPCSGASFSWPSPVNVCLYYATFLSVPPSIKSLLFDSWMSHKGACIKGFNLCLVLLGGGQVPT